jgi:hypothetical protein
MTVGIFKDTQTLEDAIICNLQKYLDIPLFCENPKEFSEGIYVRDFTG